MSIVIGPGIQIGTGINIGQFPAIVSINDFITEDSNFLTTESSDQFIEEN